MAIKQSILEMGADCYRWLVINWDYGIKKADSQPGYPIWVYQPRLLASVVPVHAG